MNDFRLLPAKLKRSTKEFRKHWQSYWWFFLPLFFLLVFSTLYFFDQEKQKEIQKTKPLSLRIPFERIAEYPTLDSVLGTSTISQKENDQVSSQANLSAEAAIVLDDESKVILFAKNEKLRFSMASTTKLMTALVALDYFKRDDVLTVKTAKVEGVNVGFEVGEKVTFENLLYAMLLPSGNDAALAIAQNYKGEEEEFIKKMNEKAQELHLFKTHFQDPAGLLDEEDYSTVVDLAWLASLVLKNKDLAEIVATDHKIISNFERTKTYNLYNLNKLLGFDGINGIKTGFTEEAGGVLVTSKAKNGHRLIIVVMKSKERFADTLELIKLTSGVTYLKVN